MRDCAATSQKPITAEQRKRLNIGANEPVVYRRVDLVCGDHVLSQADNWYVPSRLQPAMEKALETSDIPFGRAIMPLHPRRQTIGVDLLWRPIAGRLGGQSASRSFERQPGDSAGFVRASRNCVRSRRQPVSEVEEHYTSAVLDFRHSE